MQDQVNTNIGLYILPSSFQVFMDGCPVCKTKCCCGANRSKICTRTHHCYKKCPTVKKIKKYVTQKSWRGKERDTERVREREREGGEGLERGRATETDRKTGKERVNFETRKVYSIICVHYF